MIVFILFSPLQESVCHESKPEMEPIKEESESPHSSPTSRVPMATTQADNDKPTGSESASSVSQTTVSRSQEVSIKADDKSTVADDKYKDKNDET